MIIYKEPVQRREEEKKNDSNKVLKQDKLLKASNVYI